MSEAEKKSVTADPRDTLFDVSHLRMNLGAHTGYSAATVLLFAGLKLALALGTTAVLARLIPPSEHGLFALAIPAVLVAASLSEFGLAQVVVQRAEVTHRLASALFWINAGLGAFLSMLVIFLAGPAAKFYDMPEAEHVFQSLSPYAFLAVLNAQYVALLRRQMRVGAIERGSVIAFIVAGLVSVALAIVGAGVSALIAQVLLVQVVTFFFLLRSTGWIPSGPRSLFGQPLGDVLRYGGLLAAERFLNDMSRNLQIVLVGRFFSVAETGLYYRADTLAQMPQRRVLSPLSAAFIPALSRLQEDALGLRGMLKRQIIRTNLIVVPVGACMVGAADLVVEVLLGPDWAGAVPILALFGISIATSAAQSCLAWTLVAVAASRALLFFRAFNTLLVFSGVGLALWFQANLVQVTLVYVLAQSVLGLLNLSIWVGASSPITRADLMTCLVDTFGMSVVLVGAAGAVRWALDAPAWAEAGLAMLAVFALLLARIFISINIRNDILKLVRRSR